VVQNEPANVRTSRIRFIKHQASEEVQECALIVADMPATLLLKLTVASSDGPE
jgi:hypothetical protein